MKEELLVTTIVDNDKGENLGTPILQAWNGENMEWEKMVTQLTKETLTIWNCRNYVVKNQHCKRHGHVSAAVSVFNNNVTGQYFVRLLASNWRGNFISCV